jgi:YD repeat-containing protein
MPARWAERLRRRSRTTPGADHDSRAGDQHLTFGYDAANRVTSETNALNVQTTYLYDAADRLTEKHLPGGQIYHYAYDADGNTHTVTMPSGAVHTFGWSVGGRLLGYTPPGARGVLQQRVQRRWRAIGADVAERRRRAVHLRHGRPPDGSSRPDSSDSLVYAASADKDRIVR